MQRRDSVRIETREGVRGGIKGTIVPWGVVDDHGTKFRKGCFGREQVLPFMWQHAHEKAPIGFVRCYDSEYGREAEGELFLDESPDARAFARLLDAKAVQDASHGFVQAVLEGNEITHARMVEVSAVLFGSNPGAFVTLREGETDLRAALRDAAQRLEALASEAESVTDVRAGLAQVANFLGTLGFVKSELDYAAKVLQNGEGASQALTDAAEAEFQAFAKWVKSLNIGGKP